MITILLGVESNGSAPVLSGRRPYRFAELV